MSIQCKRLLSLLLAVLLVMGLPFSAMAASIDDTSPVTEPETTEPETTPDVTEPVTTEPEATEPTSAVTEPLETEPESTEPEETESVNTLSAEHQRILDELPQAIKGDDPEHPYPYGVPVDNLFPEEVQRRAMMRASMAAIPEEMYDNAILRALEYTGYDVQWLKDNGYLYVRQYVSSNLKNNAPHVLSNIGYDDYSPFCNGDETVSDPTTVSGKAPNIAKFEEQGLVCASFVTYYMCNYLPNIEGVDTTWIHDAVKATTMNNGSYSTASVWAWETGLKNLASKADSGVTRYTDATTAYANLVPGDVIIFSHSDGSLAHAAIYAGAYNLYSSSGSNGGLYHFIIHVGNSRGPEISAVEYMASAGAKSSTPSAWYHIDIDTDVASTGWIEVNKTDPNGTPLAGAYFTAVNNSTGDKFVIGPTNANGYAKSGEMPLGVYTVTETVFPDGYEASGDTSWTVTLSKDTPNQTVTINAENKRITGSLTIKKITNTGKNVSGWSFGVYTDAACKYPMLPDQMRDSRLYGVELDSITGRIAKQLYPKANITVSGFEKTDRRDFFDLAIGNVPFGQYQVNDPAYNRLGFSIHNYFFAKALDQLRPGGVLAFVTSRYTMDAKGSEVRKYLAERAQFLGAVRLPNDAFKANAGTEVVSDIRLAFSDDSSYYLLCSLEVLDDDGNMERKADMFTKRTIRQAQVVTSVDTASEALAVSIAERARVDMPYMAQLTGKTQDELASELRGVIFRLPNWSGSEDNPRFVTADEYLSGNVRKKLSEAREAAETAPELYSDNVVALEAAQPKDLEAQEIDVRLGATWIDKKYIQEFMEDLLNPPYYMRRAIKVNFSPFTAEWNITGKNNVGYRDVNANTTYGTSRMNAYHILEDTLNLRDVRVYDTVEDADGKERRVLNQKETTLAQQKQQAIKDAFTDWLWKDPERRQTLVALYNELFNSTRPREYDGSHITFGGMSPEITLREHQRNAIAHILYGGNTLLAHEVGSGKTFEMVAAAMESKRLGLCSKSLIAVPNHLTEQWASEFLRLYPSANILVARKKDFEPARRKTFCAKIATGDYDAVIIGHSQFEKIPVSQERQQRLLQEQIWEIEDGIAELRASGAERFTIKSLERTKKSLETRLQKLTSTTRKDDVVTFEQLGIDRLFVDEAHSYKNLFLYTKMRNVAGLSTTDAQKSSDMYLKCRYLDEQTGSRGVIFATGTPVSNSMTELYTMMRYLQHDTLKQKGWSHFDCWASQFGETKTVIELAPEGTGYRARTRFAKFFNLPELITIWKEAADVKTADQLNLPRPEAVYHNEVAQPTEQQKMLVQQLSERAADVHSGSVDPSVDNMLKITSDGRKLGLDQRIINPNLPDDPGSKVNMCVRNILKIWQDGEADKLTQLVFCDISTPKGRTAPARAAAKAPAGNLDSPEVHALQSLVDAPEEEPQFTVYDDIRSKLIAAGVPAEQIAFIHDANTDARKKELFGKVRTGQVRVLMGSTFKMGAGMNVQDRLIALHDLDCPWRPGDLEQRSGRIIRQGNMNPKVHIYRYVTEGTFDSYLWQTVENKQKFISQIMTSKSPVRSCEDVDETALSYAEIKALCAGDPRIKEKMDLDIDVARLKLLKADHQSQQYRLEDNLLRYFPEQIEKFKAVIAAIETDIETLKNHPHPEDGFAGMVVKGDKLTDKDNAGAALLEACKEATGLEPVEIGTYRGFTMSVTLENFGKDYILTLKGQLGYRVTLGGDARGNLIRIENELSDLSWRLNTNKQQLQNVYNQMDIAKAEIGKPFPQEAELRQKSARLTELNALLDMDGKGSKEPVVDGTIVAKSSRPSVLDKLKAPAVHGTPGKPHKIEKEVR